MVYVLFLLLMMTTLVSQYAEIGSLFAATGIPEPLLRAVALGARKTGNRL